jgi:predicted RNA-binding protein with PUA-like domain
MAHWLLKSEPSAYSWQQLVADRETVWDGVRNAQAAANLRAMQPGDEAFFYHSNIGREVVGIVRITAAAFPDPKDETGRWVAVQVAPVRPLLHPVGLAAMKAEPALADFALIRQSRLSVVPVSMAHWRLIRQMAGDAAPQPSR